MDKELQQVSKRMGQLYNIPEYENLDYSIELNAETLIKAREYFLGKMYEKGNLLGELSKMEEMAHTYYKLKHSEAVLKYSEEKVDGKALTMGKAEHKANCDPEYIAAKENWAELVGEKETVKAEYYMIRDRIQAITQHISILKQEFNFNQFQKNNEANS